MSADPETEAAALPPVEMTRERIAEFTEAIGAASLAHHSPSPARTLGHPDPDVIAPPTLTIPPSSQTQESIPQGNPLRCDHPSAIHLSEHFQHSRPITAGDVPVARAHIAHAREATDGGLLTPEMVW